MKRIYPDLYKRPSPFDKVHLQWFAESGGIFVIDGEDAGTTPWEFASITEEGTNSFALDDTVYNNGSHSYKALYTDGDQGDGAYGTISTWSEVGEIYFRFYVYVHDPFTFTNKWDYLIILSLRDGGTSLVNIALQSGSDDEPHPVDRWRVLGEELTAASSDTNFSFGTWHRVEVHWIAGTGSNDGGAEVWVDGDSIFSELNNNLNAYAADRALIGGVYTSQPGAGSYLYIDDIKAAETGPIGAYAGNDSFPIPLLMQMRRRRS